jgi:hypothetical protein
MVLGMCLGSSLSTRRLEGNSRILEIRPTFRTHAHAADGYVEIYFLWSFDLSVRKSLTLK